MHINVANIIRTQANKAEHVKSIGFKNNTIYVVINFWLTAQKYYTL